MEKPRETQRPEYFLVVIAPIFILGLTNGWYAPALTRVGTHWFWLSDVVQFVVLPAAAVIYLFKQLKTPPSKFGFRGPTTYETYWELAGLSCLAIFLYWVCFDVLRHIVARFITTPASSVLFAPALPTTQPLRFLLVLYASLTAAFVEESVYRSIPWLYFKTRLKSPRAPFVLLSSVAFAVIHWEQGLGIVISAGMLGLVAAGLYTKVENIWPFVIAHFVSSCWNYQWM